MTKQDLVQNIFQTLIKEANEDIYKAAQMAQARLLAVSQTLANQLVDGLNKIDQQQKKSDELPRTE